MSTATAGDTFRRTGEELARFAALLYQRGWMPGTSGNLSMRLQGADDLILITASGRDKGELTARDMTVVSTRTDRPVAPDALRASAETAIHTALYRTAHAGAVIHVHAPYSTAIACRTNITTHTGLLRLKQFELLKGLGLADPSTADVPVFPNWPDVSRIAADIARHYADTPDAPPCLLLSDHGVTAWGEDLAQARNRLECIEAICQLLVIDGGAAPPVQKF
ncbi:methylthioribulose 1-phosphate dehydratase [Streptomyces sp. OE57]|uniref:methylthioribulose 1-phosphate dehydratase n=1 Tax=Streptomyces lacaronensis TaxID=3379885 RepID=UPI0039B78123